MKLSISLCLGLGYGRIWSKNYVLNSWSQSFACSWPKASDEHCHWASESWNGSFGFSLSWTHGNIFSQNLYEQ